MKILLVRIDGIGDLVSSICTDQVLAPTAQATWLIARGLGFVCEQSVPKRNFFTVSRTPTLQEFFSLVKRIRQEKFDKAVIFHAPWWASLAVFLAGIKWRGGKRSQWHSYLFLANSIRQSRKRSERHEADYNMALLCESLNLPLEQPTPTTQLTSAQLPDSMPEQYYVVHPGMKGSALNISHKIYREMIGKLSESSKVVVTGTKSDEDYLAPLQSLKDHPNVLWQIGKMSGHELIATLQNARAVIAPSTGVAHLAASTGVRTIALLPPIRTQSALRWSPRGRDVKTLVPEVNCPALSKCLGPSCTQYYCMDQLTSEAIVAQIPCSK